MALVHPVQQFTVIPNGAYRQYSGRHAGLAGAAQSDPQQTLGINSANFAR
jgi:hypothetical protein